MRKVDCRRTRRPSASTISSPGMSVAAAWNPGTTSCTRTDPSRSDMNLMPSALRGPPEPFERDRLEPECGSAERSGLGELDLGLVDGEVLVGEQVVRGLLAGGEDGESSRAMRWVVRRRVSGRASGRVTGSAPAAQQAIAQQATAGARPAGCAARLAPSRGLRPGLRQCRRRGGARQRSTLPAADLPARAARAGAGQQPAALADDHPHERGGACPGRTGRWRRWGRRGRR